MESEIDAIPWQQPKCRGLNTERMADGLNDGIQETQWPVTGLGRPEFICDDFVFCGRDFVAGYYPHHSRVRIVLSSCAATICSEKRHM